MEGKFKWVNLQWKSSGSFKMKFVHKALPNKSSEVTFSLNLSNFKLLQGGTIRYSTAFPCSTSKYNLPIAKFLKKLLKPLTPIGVNDALERAPSCFQSFLTEEDAPGYKK